MCICMGMYTWVLVHMEARGVEFPATGITGSYERPNLSAQSSTHALWKSYKHS